MLELNQDMLNMLEDDTTKHHTNTILKFGKYKDDNLTLEQIGEFDEDYLIWLYDNNVIKPDLNLLGVIHKTIELKEKNSRLDLNKEMNDWYDGIFGL